MLMLSKSGFHYFRMMGGAIRLRLSELEAWHPQLKIDGHANEHGGTSDSASPN